MKTYDVIICKLNEGYNVSYAASYQKALRTLFSSADEAFDAINDWNNRKIDFQFRLIDGVVDFSYNINEERAKLGLGPLTTDDDALTFLPDVSY